jgi:hypothetical protein
MAEERQSEQDFIPLKEADFNLGDDKDHWHVTQSIVSTILEEYRTLRAESLQISSLMITILQMGVAVVGVLFGAAAVALGDKNVNIEVIAFIMLYVVIPYFIFFITTVWTGEAYRFKRVGDYIAIIEAKIEILFRRVYEKSNITDPWMGIQKQIEERLNITRSDVNLMKPLAWEQWLKSAKRSSITSYSGHLEKMYKYRIGLWLGIAVVAPLVGIIIAVSNSKDQIYIELGCVSFLACITICLHFYNIISVLNDDTDDLTIKYVSDVNTNLQL